MAADELHDEKGPEPVRCLEVKHLGEPSDWHIRASANAGISVGSIAHALPSSLLAGDTAKAVLKSVGQTSQSRREAQSGGNDPSPSRRQSER